MDIIKKFSGFCKRNIKETIIVSVIIGCFLLIGTYSLGRFIATDRESDLLMADQKVAADAQYQELCEKAEQKQEELTGIEKELSDSEQELRDNKEIIQKIQDHEKKISELSGTISKKQGEIATLTKKVDELNSAVSQKQAELDKLNGDIVKAKGQPIKLISGTYTVGKDVPAGRYRISGSSNFIVNNGLKINTILGDSIVGSGDYIGYLDEGDVIDNHAPATLTPVE